MVPLDIPRRGDHRWPVSSESVMLSKHGDLARRWKTALPFSSPFPNGSDFSSCPLFFQRTRFETRLEAAHRGRFDPRPIRDRTRRAGALHPDYDEAVLQRRPLTVIDRQVNLALPLVRKRCGEDNCGAISGLKFVQGLVEDTDLQAETRGSLGMPFGGTFAPPTRQLPSRASESSCPTRLFLRKRPFYCERPVRAFRAARESQARAPRLRSAFCIGRRDSRRGSAIGSAR